MRAILMTILFVLAAGVVDAEVWARVNGVELTDTDAGLTPQTPQAMNLTAEDGRGKLALVELMVVDELLCQEAVRRKIDQTDSFKRELRRRTAEAEQATLSRLARQLLETEPSWQQNAADRAAAAAQVDAVYAAEAARFADATEANAKQYIRGRLAAEQSARRLLDWLQPQLTQVIVRVNDRQLPAPALSAALSQGLLARFAASPQSVDPVWRLVIDGLGDDLATVVEDTVLSVGDFKAYLIDIDVVRGWTNDASGALLAAGGRFSELMKLLVVGQLARAAGLAERPVGGEHRVVDPRRAALVQTLLEVDGLASPATFLVTDADRAAVRSAAPERFAALAQRPGGKATVRQRLTDTAQLRKFTAARDAYIAKLRAAAEIEILVTTDAEHD